MLSNSNDAGMTLHILVKSQTILRHIELDCVIQVADNQNQKLPASGSVILRPNATLRNLQQLSFKKALESVRKRQKAFGAK
jgi:hypothetical protein